MPVSIQEFNALLDGSRSARFIRTNLHVHTPVTPWDWNNTENQTTRAADITPEQFMDALDGTSLELVAITDHNTVIWCEELINLASSRREEGTSIIHILPGVELSTYEGPHLLAIFDEQKSVDDINAMLVRLGLSGDGKEGEHIDQLAPEPSNTIPKVMSEVKNQGGIVIAPHVHTRDGVWGNKDFTGRTEVLNHPLLRILAAPSGDIKRVVENGNPRLLYKNMDTTHVSNSYAFINVSDCHRLEDLEENSTWIKMGEPCLEGVKQIVYEPELRVSTNALNAEIDVEHPTKIQFCDPVSVAHPHVVGMVIAGGFFDGQSLSFSAHQNCIIGKNYAGKSAIIDFLRFVLDVAPPDEETSNIFVSRLKGILFEGSEVRAYFRSADGSVYAISRMLTCSTVPGKPNTWKLDGSPELHSLIDNEFVRESDIAVSSRIDVEVYPQGEVVKIKDNADRQLSLADALANTQSDIDDLQLDEIDGHQTSRGAIIQNGLEIQQAFSDLDQIIENTQGIEALQSDIENLESLVESEAFGDIEEWTRLVTYIDQLYEFINEFHGDWTKEPQEIPTSFFPEVEDEDMSDSDSSEMDVEEISAGQTKSDFSPDKASVEEYRQEGLGFVLGTRSAIESLRGDAVAQISSVLTQLAELKVNAKARLAAAKEAIAQEATNGMEDSRAELIERITTKRQNLSTLQAEKDRAGEIRASIDKLLSFRRGMLEAFNSKWASIREKRTEIVGLIDENSADCVKAELIPDSDSQEYRSLLDQIASDLSSAANRIGRRNEQLGIIASTLAPSAFKEVIINGDANRLVEAAQGITENTARVLLGMGLKHQQALEICILGDRLLISYKKEGEDTFTPIDGGLSGGEQALALISVAMVPKEFPLMIDQPEDELGPALITVDLVEQIRQVKAHRQLIFVTHVPNIPILGDSEQIICIKQEIEDDKKKCQVDASGSLDSNNVVERLLELDGGQLAFQKRRERYSLILN